MDEKRIKTLSQKLDALKRDRRQQKNKLSGEILEAVLFLRSKRATYRQIQTIIEEVFDVYISINSLSLFFRKRFKEGGQCFTVNRTRETPENDPLSPSRKTGKERLASMSEDPLDVVMAKVRGTTNK